MPIFISIVFTLVISLFARYIISKTKLRDSDPVDTIIYSVASSISIFIVFSSYLGLLFKDHLNSALSILFLICLALFIYSIPLLIDDCKKILRAKISKHEKFALFIVVILVAKTMLLYIYHPVLDADIMATYLPLARTIYSENKIPLRDRYTNNEFTNPSIGGPILFATSYAITGNDKDENFAFYTLPFLLTLALVVYKISRTVLTKYFSLVSIAIYLSLPIIDAFFLDGILYPDIIMFFLGTSTLYFIVSKLSEGRQQVKSILVVIALSISASILLKYQGVFVAYAAIVLIIAQIIPLNALFGKVFIYLLLLFPFAIRIVNLPGITRIGSGGVNLSDSIVSLLLVSIIYPLLLKIPRIIIPKRSIILLFLVSLLGLGWFVRNKLIFGAYTISIIPELSGVNQFFAKINTQIQSLPIHNYSITDNLSLKWLAIFIFPSFGTILFIPKVYGFFLAFKNSKLYIHLYWVFLIYALNIYYFSYANSRYIFIIIPSVIIISIVGLKSIIDLLLKNTYVQTKKYYILTNYILLILMFLTLIQSVYLFRVSASNFSKKYANLTSQTEIIQSVINPNEAQFADKFSINEYLYKNKQYAIDIFQALSSDPEIYSIRSLVILGVYMIVGSGLSIILAGAISHKSISLYKIAYISGIFIILPYILNIALLSSGNISKYKQHIEQYIITYQGELSRILPYLLDHGHDRDVILKLGQVSGLAYKTNKKIIYLNTTQGVRQVIEILDRSEEEINQYYRDNNINYILISTSPYYDQIKTGINATSALLMVAQNPKYYRLVVISKTQNQWDLYERISE